MNSCTKLTDTGPSQYHWGFVSTARRFGLWTSVVALGSSLGTAYANPKNPTVIAGQATVTQPSQTDLLIQQKTDKAIINWQEFNIKKNETTKFEQPNSSSVILNRVTGGDPSQILGKMQANGTVMLVNPNGVVFGKDSRIDVNGLVATTHDIRNDDFIAGKYNFNIPGKPNAAVVNQGTITAAEGGLVALVAPGVENSGLIAARLGRITLASGSAFTLDMYGDELVRLVVDQPTAAKVYTADGRALSSFVNNSGAIQADGGIVVLTANVVRGLLDSVVNTSGLVRAQTVESKDGAIVLSGGPEGAVQVSGTLDASGKGTGKKGGSVQVTGKNVALLAGARVDASGTSGGGVALIGGDYKGGKGDPALMAKHHIIPQRKPVQNADIAYVDPQATINADATDNGRGGQVVIWSNQASGVYGSISARGGKNGGDGGFTETSSAGLLDVNTTPDVSAASGMPGTWLLDPYNITVTNDTTTSKIYTCQGTQSAQSCGMIIGTTIQEMFQNAQKYGGSVAGFEFLGGVNSSIVKASDIEYALNKGINVTIDTSGGFATGDAGGEATTGNFNRPANVLAAAENQAGVLNVNTSIIKSSGADATLSLYANSNLVINAPISSTFGKMNLRLSSSSGNISSAQDIQTNGGSITFYGKGDINFDNSGVSRTGNLYITSVGGNSGAIDIKWGSDHVKYTHSSTLATIPQNGIMLGTAGVSTYTNFYDLDGVYQNQAVTLSGTGYRYYGYSFTNGVYGAAQSVDGTPEFVNFDLDTFRAGTANNIKSGITPYFEVANALGDLKVFPLDPSLPTESETTTLNTATTISAIEKYDQVYLASTATPFHSSATIYPSGLSSNSDGSIGYADALTGERKKFDFTIWGVASVEPDLVLLNDGSYIVRTDYDLIKAALGFAGPEVLFSMIESNPNINLAQSESWKQLYVKQNDGTYAASQNQVAAFQLWNAYLLEKNSGQALNIPESNPVLKKVSELALGIGSSVDDFLDAARESGIGVKDIISISLDLYPATSYPKGIIDLVRGKDTITGQEVSRIVIAAGLIPTKKLAKAEEAAETITLVAKVYKRTLELREALKVNVPAGLTDWAAHHIVPIGHKDAAIARDILEKYGIDINSAVNGVALPRNLGSSNPYGMAVHSTLHTNEYVSDVVNAIVVADRQGGKGAVLDALQNIRNRLSSGEY